MLTLPAKSEIRSKVRIILRLGSMPSAVKSFHSFFRKVCAYATSVWKFTVYYPKFVYTYVVCVIRIIHVNWSKTLFDILHLICILVWYFCLYQMASRILHVCVIYESFDEIITTIREIFRAQLGQTHETKRNIFKSESLICVQT